MKNGVPTTAPAGSRSTTYRGATVASCSPASSPERSPWAACPHGSTAGCVAASPIVRDRGALSLEQAIVTAVLSAAAIALGVVIVNAVVSHQNQIR